MTCKRALLFVLILAAVIKKTRIPIMKFSFKFLPLNTTNLSNIAIGEKYSIFHKGTERTSRITEVTKSRKFVTAYFASNNFFSGSGKRERK